MIFYLDKLWNGKKFWKCSHVIFMPHFIHANILIFSAYFASKRAVWHDSCNRYKCGSLFDTLTASLLASVLTKEFS